MSDFGTALTTIVLPLLAMSALHAQPGELGVLRAMTSAAVLVAAVPAGVYVDRVSKRSVMIWCDIARAVVLLSVPVLVWFGWLTLVWLCVAVFLLGVFSVVFGLAYHAYVPHCVARNQLPEANSKMATTESVARVSGPGVGGFLAGVIGAAATLLVDVASYVVSAVCLAAIPRDTPTTTAVDQRPSWRQSVATGFALLVANPPLARTAFTTVGAMFALTMMTPLLMFYLRVDVGLSEATVGAVFLLGEAGGLIAAVAASRVMRWVGSARIMWLVVFLSPAGFLVTAFPDFPVVCAVGYLLLTSTRFVLFDIAQYSYRQTACPIEKLGSVTASIRFCIGAAGVTGALLGGWLGDVAGVRVAMMAATTIMCVTALPVAWSSLWRTRNIEDLPQVVLPDNGQPR